MNEKEYQGWGNTRKKGFAIYVLIDGVLKWGLFTSIAFWLIADVPFNGFSITNLISVSKVFIIGGTFFGVSTWFSQEYMFKKELGKRGSS